MTRTGRTLSYTASDRDAHYTGTIPATRCPVCLVGMAATHGRSDIAYAAPDPAPAPWSDAVPFDSAPPVPAGWSIVSDGATPQDAVSTAERYRSHGRAAVVTRYGCRALSGAHYVAYRVTVDIAPDDAAWAAYRGQ